jgi:hypothetical protein
MTPCTALQDWMSPCTALQDWMFLATSLRERGQSQGSGFELQHLVKFNLDK